MSLEEQIQKQDEQDTIGGISSRRLFAFCSNLLQPELGASDKQISS